MAHPSSYGEGQPFKAARHSEKVGWARGWDLPSHEAPPIGRTQPTTTGEEGRRSGAPGHGQYSVRPSMRPSDPSWVRRCVRSVKNHLSLSRLRKPSERRPTRLAAVRQWGLPQGKKPRCRVYAARAPPATVGTHQATGKGRAPTHTRGGVWGPFVRMTPFLSKWLETPGIRQGPPLNARGAVCRRQCEPPVTPMRTL